MIELSDTRIRRGIPSSKFYVELHESGVEIKVRGSRKPGVFVGWTDLLVKTRPPGCAPAKCGTGLEYLKDIVAKLEKRRDKNKKGEGSCQD